MHQPVVYEPAPAEVDLNGLVDRQGIAYIGIATRQQNGKYVCLADVDGCLCLVEVSLSFEEKKS